MNRYIKIKNKELGSSYMTTPEKAVEDMANWLAESDESETWELTVVFMEEDEYKALPEFYGF